MGYDEVLGELKAGKAGSGLPCHTVRRLLEELGFKVKDGSKGGHKTVTHAGLPGFISTGYNCKGGGGEVSRNYLGSLITVLRTYEDAIRSYLSEHGSGH